MSDLQTLQLKFGKAGAPLHPFSMVFQPKFPTQAFIGGCLAKGQLCDPPLVQALTESLVPGDCFIDVGSHIGYYSLLAMQMVGPTGSVFAFEPNPNTYFVLAASAQVNRYANMYTYNCAVGDAVGTATFNINVADEGMSSLVFRDPKATQVTVATTTLDQFAEFARLDKVRVLKIDVEGFEENVVHGGRKLLASGAVESVVFEINNNFSTIPKHRDQAIRKHLATLGYRSYLIRPWMGEAEWQARFGDGNYLRVPDEMPIEIPYGNVLATRREVAAAGWGD